jgi:O-Antigen ligase/Tetratricopeptide repeat
VALLTLIAVIWLAFTDGGYFPVMWGWVALAFLWIAVLVLLLRDHLRLSRMEWAALISFGTFIGWISLSAIWSSNPAQTVLEMERAVLYLAAIVTVLLVARRGAVPELLGGIATGITVASGFGLAVRLFPDRIGDYDPLELYRLSRPLGYSNALGIFAAIGALLMLGFAARARHPARRALAAASTVVLVLTIYFAFGRGAPIALGLGVVAMIVIDPRRLQLLTTLMIVAPAPTLAVWVASRSDALTELGSPFSEVTEQGQRLGLLVPVLALGAGLMSLVVALAESRVLIGSAARRAFTGVLVLAVVLALGVVFVRFGGPPTLVERTYDGLRGPLLVTQPGASQNVRFQTLASPERLDFWDVAWSDFRAHPWLGSGAGSYERYWLEHRPNSSKVRDAHSLYLETLAELGPVGLALLLTALAIPVVAAASARRHQLVPVAFGGYVAYLVHTGVDWDWEMPAVTLTALLCGAAILVSSRDEAAHWVGLGVRFGSLAVVIALGGFSFVGLIGNAAVAASDEARDHGRLETAESEARKAIDWMPWSAEPWLQLARAQRDQNDLAAARRSLRNAIAEDPDNWRLWYVLARVTSGQVRAHAIARGLVLNPLSPQLAGFRAELAAKGAGAGP